MIVPRALPLIIPMLAVALPQPAAAACDICGLRLTARSGPVAIVAWKETMDRRNPAARLRVRFLNRSSHTVVLGGVSPSMQVRLNFVTPRSRGTEIVNVDPNGPHRRLPPKASAAFDVTYPYRLGSPGLYRFTVSYGGGESNVVTYDVR